MLLIADTHRERNVLLERIAPVLRAAGKHCAVEVGFSDMRLVVKCKLRVLLDASYYWRRIYELYLSYANCVYIIYIPHR